MCANKCGLGGRLCTEQCNQATLLTNAFCAIETSARNTKERTKACAKLIMEHIISDITDSQMCTLPWKREQRLLGRKQKWYGTVRLPSLEFRLNVLDREMRLETCSIRRALTEECGDRFMEGVGVGKMNPDG